MDTFDLVIGILTYNRGELLERTVTSLIEKVPSVKEDRVKWLLFDNGSNMKNRFKNQQLCNTYGIEYYSTEMLKEKQLDNGKKDRQIAEGHQQLIANMLMHNASVYLILEDDWACIRSVNATMFEGLIQYMASNDHIGQLRLRECAYDGTLTGCSFRNFITKDLIEWQSEIIAPVAGIQLGNLHWVNNPSLITRKALELVSGNFEDEIQCMAHFHKYYPINAQLKPGLFEHIGPWRKRNDLIEKGYVSDENEILS